MSDALIGEKLGQYEIRMLLGKGGMSTVYLAHQPSMDRVVAIKVLPREFLHDDTFLTRFQREVRTIARLEHLHILPIYDVGEADGVPYYVMRYLAGGTLADLIESRLPDMQTILRVTEQIGGALDYAHERGIIHRDLKPSNVLLDNGGNAYLADFGIARLREEVTTADEKRLVGTPSYIAPEMVRPDEPVTHKVDIYALGAMTYQMFTGDPPYVASDPMAVLMSHVMEPVPSVRDFDPNVSRAVDEAVQRSLAKSPADRYESAGAFVTALRRAAEGGYPTLEVQPVAEDGRTPAAPVEAPAGEDSELEDTQPGAAVEVPPPYAEPWPGEPVYEPERRPRRRRRGLPTGCIAVAGVLLALLAGMVVSAFALTEGDPLSLMRALTPIFDFQPRGSGAEEPIAVTFAPQDGTTEPAEPVETQAAPVVEPGGPAVLPPPASGARFAFTSNRDGDYEIYLIEADASGLRQLTDNETFDFDADWSPDGNSIVYVTTIGGYAEIMVMDADGENVRQLTDNREIRDSDPAWSPDGTRIAFSSERDGDFDIYTMRPDGSDVQQITFNDNLDDLNPSWSPDGEMLVYYAREPENAASSELYIVPAGGGAPQRLTANDVLDQWPDWSPDGTRIVFTSGLDAANPGWRSLYLLDLASGEIGPLTESVGRDDDPVWSADGRYIAFDSDRDGDGVFDLYVLELETREVRRVTSEDGNDVAPAWQPLR